MTAPTKANGHQNSPYQQVPHSIPAEQAVLGAMMLSPRIADEIIELLRGRDFYDHRHADLYAQLTARLAAGLPIDSLSISQALADADKLGTGPGKIPLDYLHTIAAAPPTAANGPYYARIVRDKAVLRRLAETGTRIAQLGFGSEDSGRTAEEAADLAQQLIHEATAAEVAVDLGPVGDWIDTEIAELEAIVEGTRPRGITTGFRDLDELLGGQKPGQLIIPAGRPGMGKTTLAMDFAKAAAKSGHPTFVFSVEMSRGEVINRILSDLAKINTDRFTTGQLTRDDLTAINRSRDTLAGWPLHIYDRFRTVGQIRAATRRLTQRFGTPGVVVVDYLQRLTAEKRADRRDLEIGQFARDLKTLSQEIGTCVVAPAQLNRGSETRSDKRPQLSDLRDSGELEQEADVVILIHRDDYYDSESARAGEADLIVAKHRHGPTDTITVAAQLHFARFKDMAIGGRW